MPRTSDAFFGGLTRVRGSHRTRYSLEEINWLTDRPRLCFRGNLEREGVVIRSVDHRISFQTIRKRILQGIQGDWIDGFHRLSLPCVSFSFFRTKSSKAVTKANSRLEDSLAEKR